MNTGDICTSSMAVQESSPRNARRAAFLLPMGAILLGGMLLSLFIGVVRASAAPGNQIQSHAFINPLAPDAMTLTITKNSVPAQFIIGDYIDTLNKYHISVAMAPGSDSPPYVRVEDKLPAGLSIDSIDATDWNCSLYEARTKVICTYASTIPPSGDVFPGIFFNINVASSVAASVSNTAYLYYSDGVPPVSHTTTTTINSVDLVLDKSVTPTYADVGKQVTYTIKVTNNGPALASNVKVVDVMPTGVTYDVANAEKDGLPYTPGMVSSSSAVTVTWNLGAMPSGSSVTLTLPAVPTSAAAGKKLTNTATASSDNLSDWYTLNNTDSAFFYVSGLVITKTASLTTTAAGIPYIYTITVSNHGTTSASSVVVRDVFTPALHVRSASNCSISGNTVTGSYGTLAANSSKTCVVTVRGNELITPTKQITNLATVSAYPSVVRASNIVTVTLNPAANVQLGKSDGLSQVFAGQIVTYTVKITNTGSITAYNVVFTDNVLNISQIAVISDGVAITNVQTTTPPYSWNLKNPLGPGDMVSFRVRAKVLSSATVGAIVRNTLQATCTGDSYAADNTATDEDTVIAQSGMSISKGVSASQVKVGDNLSFQIKVKNTGASNVTTVRVEDTLPSVLDYVNNVPSSGSASVNATTRTVTWNIGTLSAGATVTLTINTKVNSTAQVNTTYSNIGKLFWDPSLTMNSNEAKFRVLAGALPGTGLGPPRQSGLPLVTSLVLLISLSLPSLAYSLWTSLRRKKGQRIGY